MAELKRGARKEAMKEVRTLRILARTLLPQAPKPGSELKEQKRELSELETFRGGYKVP